MRSFPTPLRFTGIDPPLRPKRVVGASGAQGPVVASVMSWVKATAFVHGDGEEGDVFDEEADESVLVQREWRSHMQRRVKVKLRRGRGGHLIA